MTVRRMVSVFIGLLLGFSFTTAAHADGALEEAKKRGHLLVGVKNEFLPFGYVDKAGEIVGFEVDLARDVAQRLGVELKLVPVISANRMQFLQQGRIDLMIATMSFRPERAEAVGVVQPPYYASAQGLLAPKSASPKLTRWDDLRDKPVCGVQGAFYNSEVSSKNGAKVVNFKDTTEALKGLKEGKCVGMAYDVTFFASKLLEPEWSDYELPLPAINEDPWVLAVKKEDTAFQSYMVTVVEDWHRSGKLIELEAKWKLPTSPFLKQQQEKLK